LKGSTAPHEYVNRIYVIDSDRMVPRVGAAAVFRFRFRRRSRMRRDDDGWSLFPKPQRREGGSEQWSKQEPRARAGQRRGVVPPSEPHAMSPIASPMLSTPLPRIVLQSDPCILEKRELNQPTMDCCHKQQDRPRGKSGGGAALAAVGGNNHREASLG